MNEILTIDTTKGIVKNSEIYNLVPENDKILKEKCVDFDFQNPPMDAVKLANSLFDTMFKFKGLGLSANQCGKNYRVFVVGFDDTNKQVFFNPEITESSEETAIDIEGCLSYNKLFMRIKRPVWIKIKYQHVNGEVRENKFTGLTARIIQHEMDHMNGVTFIERAGKVTYQLANEKRKKLQKKMERVKK